MKKFLISGFIALLLLGLVGLLNTPTATEVEAKGAHPKTTGSFVAIVGSTSIEMEISAHYLHQEAKGEVTYSNSRNKGFWGDVDICYEQEGSRSVMVGTLRGGDYGEGFFKVWVYDGGEGRNAEEEDRVRVVVYPEKPDCEGIVTGYPATILEGNIQVHK
jgi:hypothetical protein